MDPWLKQELMMRRSAIPAVPMRRELRKPHPPARVPIPMEADERRKP